jgi:nucleotide-binding universal stress UspA family protein
MSRSVVCGIDGSEEAVQAASLAEMLATALGAEPVLVHAVKRMGTFPYADEWMHETRLKDSLASGGAALHEVELDGHDEVERRIVCDAPAKALTRVATETNAALVAVGCRRRGRLRAALFGSTSQATLRSAERPVLVVPRGASGQRMGGGRTIVCGLSGSEASTDALRAAVTLSRGLSVELVLLQVRKRVSATAMPGPGLAVPLDLHGMDHRQRQQLTETAERIDESLDDELPVRQRVASGDVAGELERVGSEEDALLIVVGWRRRPALHNAALASPAAALCRRATRPVLVVPKGSSLYGHDERKQQRTA